MDQASIVAICYEQLQQSSAAVYVFVCDTNVVLNGLEYFHNISRLMKLRISLLSLAVARFWIFRVPGHLGSTLCSAYYQFADSQGAKMALGLNGMRVDGHYIQVQPSLTNIEPVDPKFLPKIREARLCPYVDNREASKLKAQKIFEAFNNDYIKESMMKAEGFDANKSFVELWLMQIENNESIFQLLYYQDLVQSYQERNGPLDEEEDQGASSAAAGLPGLRKCTTTVVDVSKDP